MPTRNSLVDSKSFWELQGKFWLHHLGYFSSGLLQISFLQRSTLWGPETKILMYRGVLKEDESDIINKGWKKWMSGEIGKIPAGNGFQYLELDTYNKYTFKLFRVNNRGMGTYGVKILWAEAMHWCQIVEHNRDMSELEWEIQVFCSFVFMLRSRSKVIPARLKKSPLSRSVALMTIA